MKKQTKKFLKRPEYPGGKSAFKEYIRNNLIYPKEALEKGIGGVVYLSARIDDNGNVDDINVEKGIGYGCDEEAVRLIGNMRYGAVRNRGVRVKSIHRFRIEFRLPKLKKTLKYTYKHAPKQTPEQTNKPKTYSYSIKVKND